MRSYWGIDTHSAPWPWNPVFATKPAMVTGVRAGPICTVMPSFTPRVRSAVSAHA